MEKKIVFDSVLRERIATSVREDLGITDPEQISLYIETCEKTGAYVPPFGTASLLSYSHLQNPDESYKDNLEEMFPGIDMNKVDVVIPGILQDYKKDFVCFDVHYRGTEESPGITIGNEKEAGATTEGGVLESRIDYLTPEVAADFIEYNNKMFKQREFPPNMPIYKFELVEVKTKETGEIVTSLCCVADSEGPLYIHNPENRIAQKNDFYFIERGDDEKKATIMATAHRATNPTTGEAKPRGSITDLDYLRNMIEDSFKNNVEVASRFHKLYGDAVMWRMTLKAHEPEAYKQLVTYEREKISNAPNLLANFMVSIGEHNAKVRQAANDDLNSDMKLEA